MNPAVGGSAGGRGHHVVFLGYAPGVGKTYAMLLEARRRARLGEDVVVGLLEAHARPETTALATGLETLPLKVVEYRGAHLTELDLDAALARHPDWLLVDELAHTNVCGDDCEKRWQSVERLLDAGIGVMSTLNAQHVASLNSFTFQVTGVRVRETVPDDVLAAADEVVLVDLAPDDLVDRLQRGRVCGSSEVGSALTHFFHRNSLEALRGQALALASRYDDPPRVCSGQSSPTKSHRVVERLRSLRKNRPRTWLLGGDIDFW